MKFLLCAAILFIISGFGMKSRLLKEANDLSKLFKKKIQDLVRPNDTVKKEENNEIGSQLITDDIQIDSTLEPEMSILGMENQISQEIEYIVRCDSKLQDEGAELPESIEPMLQQEHKLKDKIFTSGEKDFENNYTDHPLGLVTKNLEKFKQSENFSEEKKLCVLISTGSLNPIHLGHVQAFLSAKEVLEEKHNFKVLAGFVSPSDSHWCRSKEYGCYSNQFRLDLVKLAVEDYEWLEADGWEINSNSIKDFPEVCRNLKESVETEFTEDEIEVLYLCGTDHAAKCGLFFGNKSYGVCVMKRPGYQERKTGKNVYLCDVNEVDASSTEVRRAAVFDQLDSVEHKLHPKVCEALKNTTEELNKF